MAIKSQGITLTMLEGDWEAASKTFDASMNTAGALECVNLLEIPEIGVSESGFEQIDVTTLADPKFVYMNGLETAGESDALEFRFLYEKEQFQKLEKGAAYKHGTWDADHAIAHVTQWTITLPDGSKCVFYGHHTVRLEGVGVNAAITYILSVTPDSEFGKEVFDWTFAGE